MPFWESKGFKSIQWQKLCWDHHIDGVCKKISSRLFRLQNWSFYRSTKVLKIVYFGLFLPYILYGLIFKGNCAGSKVSRILILQNPAFSIMSKLKFIESCRNTFKSLEILTYMKMYKYIMKLIHMWHFSFMFSKIQSIIITRLAIKKN